MRVQKSLILLLIGICVSALATIFEGHINAYYFQVIIYIGINIILASSLNLINGFAGQFSLGHAGFMAIGAYTSAVITRGLGVGQGSVFAIPAFALALLVAGVMAAICGLFVGIPTLRLKGDYLAITTLGFGEIIRVIIQNLNFLGAARGFTGIPKLTNSFWVFASVALVIFLIYNLINSTYGKAFLAVRDDEIAAEAIGISSTKVKVVAFITGAFFAGVAGGLYAHFVTYINPQQFSFLKSFEIVVMVIIGGMGSIIGVILSATLLTILPEALRSVAQYRMVLYSLLLIIIMITRPQGLFIRKRIVKRGIVPKTEIS
ncbi:MAG TPA: branched-chain amino acid ABC transporter permease [candidate division Zixibacteria bacterium]|jgi:branched-chain amino acid transport system permease protein|nr:branched-chain amino acid ABC transporter permease [candidate division Zixibacteria bacterium]